MASLYRGEYAAAQSRDPSRRYYEVTGAAAKIQEPFGPDSDEADGIEDLADRYPLRGGKRLSTMPGAAGFTMVETYANLLIPFEDEALRDWTGAEVFTFWTVVAPDPFRQNWPVPIADQAIPDHGMSFVSPDGSSRTIGVSKYDGLVHFTNTGTPFPFEKTSAYKKKQKLERLNRYDIMNFMTQVGLAPDAAVLRRGLKDPILYTSDHIGKSVSEYKDLIPAYLKFLS